MAGSVNKQIILGNLGADPEIRSFQNGGRVANLRIATSETWKDKNTGERKEQTDWHTVAVFGDGLVGVVERFLKLDDQRIECPALWRKHLPVLDVRRFVISRSGLEGLLKVFPHRTSLGIGPALIDHQAIAAALPHRKSHLFMGDQATLDSPGVE